MSRFIYTFAFSLLLPFILLRLLWRSRQNPAYRQRLAERFGFVHPLSADKPCIWIHSVSVGETIAARPLVEQLLREYPGHSLWITTTTPTGFDTVKRLYGERVQHSYFPYDLPDSVARFLKRVQPSLLLVMETEIWPNLYAACHKRGIPLLLLNARLSERSFQRYRKFNALTRPTIGCIHWIGARSEQDAAFFRQLGANPEQTGACGNLKFALQIPAGLQAQAAELKQRWGNCLVTVAASTHSGEDEILLSTFARIHQQEPNALLILVPRHPERFDTVYKLCADTGLPVVRRSSGETLTATTAILLGDSMGELLLWYALADIAFIGGSLIPHGGHNPLEAAAFGVPVLSGAHTHNFTDIFPDLYAAKGAVEISDETSLYTQWLAWLQDDVSRRQAGVQAAGFFAQRQSVLECLLQHIRPLLRKAV